MLLYYDFCCWVDLSDCFVEKWVMLFLLVVIQKAFIWSVTCSFNSGLLVASSNASCFPMLSRLCISINIFLAAFLVLLSLWVYLDFLACPLPAQLRFISALFLFPIFLLWSSIVMLYLWLAFLFLVFPSMLFRSTIVLFQPSPSLLIHLESFPSLTVVCLPISALLNSAKANSLLWPEFPCSEVSSNHSTVQRITFYWILPSWIWFYRRWLQR